MKPKITNTMTVGVSEETYARIILAKGNKKMADWLRESVEVYLDVLENQTGNDVRTPKKA